MKRYVISPITGFGTITNPYKASVSLVAPTVSIIPTDNTGKPLYRFCFCLVNTDRLSDVSAVSNTYIFPDYALDAKMEGMEANSRASMVQSVGAYVLDDNNKKLDITHRDIDGYRDVLVSLAKQFDTSFNIDNFDVGVS